MAIAGIVVSAPQERLAELRILLLGLRGVLEVRETAGAGRLASSPLRESVLPRAKRGPANSPSCTSRKSMRRPSRSTRLTCTRTRLPMA